MASKSIGFRLSGAELERFEAAAAERGMSPSEVAREAVNAWIQAGEEPEPEAAFPAATLEVQTPGSEPALLLELRRTRADLATVLETLLLNLPFEPQLNPEQVKAWISKTLRVE